MHRNKFRIALQNVASNGSWEGMPVGLLKRRQLLNEPALLAFPHRDLNLGGEHLAARIVHAPARGNSTRSLGGMELELLDVFFGKEKDPTGLVGWQPPEINVAIDALIGDPQHLG